MNLTIKELLKGKATVIKGKEYLSTELYVTPFLEFMSKFTDKFIIQTRLSNQMSLTMENNNNSEDTIFNRVWIQAVMPDECGFKNHQEVISLVYGLDTRKPVAKIYRGALNMACLNLCVFNPSFIDVQGIEPEKPINYKPLKTIIEQTSDIKVCLEKLSSTIIPYDEDKINYSLGLWIRNILQTSYDSGYGKVKIATNAAIDAYKLLYEKKDSPYYIKAGEDTNAFNIYNAFTEVISNVDTRDIMNKAEKTLLLKDILNFV